MESRIVRVNRTLYVRIPAAEARRLHLHEGQAVKLEVEPSGLSAAVVLATHRGKFARGKPLTDEELWGDV